MGLRVTNLDLNYTDDEVLTGRFFQEQRVGISCGRALVSRTSVLLHFQDYDHSGCWGGNCSLAEDSRRTVSSQSLHLERRVSDIEEDRQVIQSAGEAGSISNRKDPPGDKDNVLRCRQTAEIKDLICINRAVYEKHFLTCLLEVKVVGLTRHLRNCHRHHLLESSLGLVLPAASNEIGRSKRGPETHGFIIMKEI